MLKLPTHHKVMAFAGQQGESIGPSIVKSPSFSEPSALRELSGKRMTRPEQCERWWRDLP